MALTERLALLVTLDADNAIRGLEGVGKAADQNLGKIGNKADIAAARFKKAGAGMMAGAGLMATGLYKAGQSAAELEQSVGGTEAVFKDASGYIEKYAKGAARNMGLSETAFRAATTSIGGQLKGVGFDIDTAAEKSVQLTGVAADLAATYGGTTAEAVAALGAAFRGEADPAERFNLRLNQNTVNAKAVEMGLAASTSQVDAHAKAQATLALILEQSADAQGQFAREADTASGAMAIASAEFENAKASLGQSVAPVIADVSSKLADLAGGFLAANEASDGLLSKLATYGTIGLGAAGGLSFAVGKAIEMRKVFTSLDGPFRNASGGLSKFGKVAAGLGLAGVAVAIYDLAQAAGGATVDVDKLTAAMEGMSRAEEQQLQGILRIASSWGDLDDIVSQTADSNVLAAERLVEQAEAAGITGDELQSLKDIVLEKREADVQGAKDQEAYARQTQAAAGATSGLTGALDANAPAVETAAEKIERLKGELEDATQAISDNYSAMHEATGLAINYEAAIDDLIDGLKENGTTLDISTEKGRANMQQLIDTGESIADLIQKRYEETGSIETAEIAGAMYVENLKNQLRQAGFTEDAIADLIAQMKLTPADIKTNILADTADASRAVYDYQRLINNTPRMITTTFNGVVVNRPNRMERNANGTSFFHGGYSLVGERGPEIVELPRGAKVKTATETANMLGGSVGTIVIPVSIGGREVERLVVDANARTVRRGYAA